MKRALVRLIVLLSVQVGYSQGAKMQGDTTRSLLQFEPHIFWGITSVGNFIPIKHEVSISVTFLRLFSRLNFGVNSATYDGLGLVMLYSVTETSALGYGYQMNYNPFAKDYQIKPQWAFTITYRLR